MTDRYAVMGHPISHSKSPFIHARFSHETNQTMTYEAIHVEPGHFDQAVQSFRAEQGQGLNITLPFKQEAWKLAQSCSERADRARAVNTLCFGDDGRIHGDNTDGVGLIRDLSLSCDLSVRDRSVLLVGAGGAARGTLCALLDENPHRVVLSNRTAEKARALVAELGPHDNLRSRSFNELTGLQFDLVISATAASLEGQVPAIPVSVLNRDSVCYDMMYGAGPSAFMAWGAQHGAARTVDGLGMLVEQAAESFFLWRGVRPDTRACLRDLRARIETKNPVRQTDSFTI